MTRKRYIKLFYALAQKINQAHINACGRPAPGWGKALKAVTTIKFGTDRAPEFNSYAEAWESIKPIRQQYGM